MKSESLEYIGCKKVIEAMIDLFEEEGIQILSGYSIKVPYIEVSYLADFLSFVKACVEKGYPPVVFYYHGKLYYLINNAAIATSIVDIYINIMPRSVIEGKAVELPYLIPQEIIDKRTKGTDWDRFNQKAIDIILKLRKEMEEEKSRREGG